MPSYLKNIVSLLCLVVTLSLQPFIVIQRFGDLDDTLPQLTTSAAVFQHLERPIIEIEHHEAHLVPDALLVEHLKWRNAFPCPNPLGLTFAPSTDLIHLQHIYPMHRGTFPGSGKLRCGLLESLFSSLNNETKPPPCPSRLSTNSQYLWMDDELDLDSYSQIALRRSSDNNRGRGQALMEMFAFSGASSKFLESEELSVQLQPFWNLYYYHGVSAKQQSETANVLPCTAFAQSRLYSYQYGPGAAGPHDAATHQQLLRSPKTRRDIIAWCSQQRFLISKLKDGAHGFGSAVTLLAHDFLSAIMLGRRLELSASGEWHFAPRRACGSRRSWTCLFLPTSICSTLGLGEAFKSWNASDMYFQIFKSRISSVSSYKQAKKATSRLIQKKNFDIPGLGRSDIPTLEQFFGVSGGSASAGERAAVNRCISMVKTWVQSPQASRITGTFKKGADPLLYYMMAQTTRFLMRGVQPWFSMMLLHHVKDVLPSLNIHHVNSTTKYHDEGQRLIYVQDRGELAKYREYYASLGCHTFDVVRGIPTVVSSLLRSFRIRDPSAEVVVYVSGNTPPDVFTKLKGALGDTKVLSIWDSPLGGKTSSTRWGATHPAASWVDLWIGAGGAAVGWACIAQSNWCRVIDFLRLTQTGRGPGCPFVDLGLLLLAHQDIRREYCVVRKEWPMKPFSGAGDKGTLKD